MTRDKEKQREHRLKNRKKYNEAAMRWYYSRTEEQKQRKRDNTKIWQRNRYKLLRELVIEKYGNKCNCCGETIKEFLTIDHINGGGIKDRKQWSSIYFLNQMIKDYNSDKYQILCWNCNCARKLGDCPHQRAF